MRALRARRRRRRAADARTERRGGHRSARARRARHPGADARTRLLGTDATGIPVLDPDRAEGIRNGTIWAWTGARWVTFFYSPTGDAESVKRFLGEDLAAPCSATARASPTSSSARAASAPGAGPTHAAARRRPPAPATASPSRACASSPACSPSSASQRPPATTPKQRRERRQRASRPVLDELREWLDRRRRVTPPKTPLGQGLGYLHRQWKRLFYSSTTGNIEATNNRRERELEASRARPEELALHLARRRRRADWRTSSRSSRPA